MNHENSFGRASNFNQFAAILHDSLSKSDYELISSSEFSSTRFVFSLLRSSSNYSIPLLRLLNPRLCDQLVDEGQSFAVWQECNRGSLEYLIDLSQIESHILDSSPSDLLLCESISTMIPLIIKGMNQIHCTFR
jgi:hypothetical protein